MSKKEEPKDWDSRYDQEDPKRIKEQKCNLCDDPAYFRVEDIEGDSWFYCWSCLKFE